MKLINSNAYWKLYQLGIDTTDEPPLFGLSSEDTNSIFRITNIATETYKNTTLNFYKYQLDVGRFHIMSVQPGKCDTIGTNDDYSNLHVVYVHMENKIVDLCVDVIFENVCGNGILEKGEDCDDGNNRNGDGCNSACQIELNWRCYNDPYATRTLCDRNECGDGNVNQEHPEYEA